MRGVSLQGIDNSRQVFESFSLIDTRVIGWLDLNSWIFCNKEKVVALLIFMFSGQIYRKKRASSKTLTSGSGATEEWIADGALSEQWITPGPPRIIPEDYKNARSLRNNTEQYGAPRWRTEHLWIAFSNRFMLSLYHFLGFILSFYDYIIFQGFYFWVPSALYNLVI